MTWARIQSLRDDIANAEAMLDALKAELHAACEEVYATGETTSPDGVRLTVMHKDGVRQNLNMDKIKARHPNAYAEIREAALVNWEPRITKKQMEAYFSRTFGVKGPAAAGHMADVCDEVKVPRVYGFRTPRGWGDEQEGGDVE